MGRGKHVLDVGPDPPCARAVLREKGAADSKVQGSSAVSCAKIAETIKMLFQLWIQVVRRTYVLDGGAHRRHLANTIGRPC